MFVGINVINQQKAKAENIGLINCHTACYENSNKLSAFMKGEIILEYLCNYHLLKTCPVSWSNFLPTRGVKSPGCQVVVAPCYHWVFSMELASCHLVGPRILKWLHYSWENYALLLYTFP
jgi:hypothetical protein